MDYLRTTSSGILTRTDDPTLHAVIERSGGGFDYYRYDAGNPHWSGPYASAGSTGNIHDVAIFTGLGRRLNVLYREVKEKLPGKSSHKDAGRLFHTWSSPVHEPTSFPWGGERTERTGGEFYAGAPGVCRWRLDNHGLDALIALEGSGLQHWYRNEGGAWSLGPIVDHGRHYAGCALVMGHGKELVAVAVDASGDLWLHQRGANNEWGTTAKKIASGVKSNPALVQSDRSGIQYDLVLAGEGALKHYIILPGFDMRHVRTFGHPGRTYRRVGLVYTGGNSLEVVAQADDRGLEHFLFDGNDWKAGRTPHPVIAEGSSKVEHDTQIIGIHATLLHTGEVLLAGMNDADEDGARGRLLDTATGVITTVPSMPHVFCSGHTQLADGNILVAGGHKGHEHVLHVFQRTTAGWSWKQIKPDLHGGRWYPTCTTLPDGKVLIIAGTLLASGAERNNSYEIYDPANPDKARTTVALSAKLKHEWFCMDTHYVDMYPFVYVLPNGKVFVHSRNTTRFWSYDPAKGDGEWSSRIAAAPHVRTYPHQGTSVLLPLEPDANGDYAATKVMLIGGGTINGGIDTPALRSCEVMTVDVADPVWTDAAPLVKARVMPDAVLLPDGNVLVVNGSRTGRGDGKMSRQPELDVELYDRFAGRFSVVATMQTPRLYHAAAILLPDARVLVTGKCKVYNTPPYDYPEHRGEVYTPAYLQNEHARPAITSAPTELAAGAWFDIGLENAFPGTIARVVLIHASSSTHSFNMAQRAVVLSIRLNDGKLQALTPKTNWVVPPGYYMLFAVSRDGVPSKAWWVRVPVFA